MTSSMWMIASVVGVAILAIWPQEILVHPGIRLTSTRRDPEAAQIDISQPPENLLQEHPRVLIVGGTRGIGRGIAKQWLRRAVGAHVTVVGRHTETIVEELKAVLPDNDENSSRAHIKAFAADLFTVKGAQALGEALKEAYGDESSSFVFDYVFFTAGTWPSYCTTKKNGKNEYYTADGMERTVALDLIARHIIFHDLWKNQLIRNKQSTIISTLASTQYFPFQSVSSVQHHLQFKSIAPSSSDQSQMKHSTKECGADWMAPFSTLFPAALAVDAWLWETSRKFPQLTFVGTFPGLVDTNVFVPAMPYDWMVRLVKLIKKPLAWTEEQSGQSHVLIATTRHHKGEKASKNIFFFNHLGDGRYAHPVAQDVQLGQWVYFFADQWVQSKTTTLSAAE